MENEEKKPIGLMGDCPFSGKECVYTPTDPVFKVGNNLPPDRYVCPVFDGDRRQCGLLSAVQYLERIAEAINDFRQEYRG